MQKSLRRVAAPIILAAGAVALGSAPAAAHVSVEPSTTVAGEYAVLTFSVPHGCDGSPTTKVAIDIPKGVDVVTPTVNDGWTVTKKTEPVPNSSTDRVSRVTYATNKPLPDGYRDAFELSVPLPEKPGETLVFPTMQTCQKGKTNWNQVPKEGQSEDDLDAPAPAVTLSEAGSESDSSSTEEVSESASTGAGADDTDEAASSDGSSDGLAWTALGVGAAGVVVGGVALTRSRTRT